ncbi:hypothetical protein J6590_102833 [Homalodisca vitripennis]|nr:hypothetical protein J6590_102833 [Homalodisca vitripennis]
MAKAARRASSPHSADWCRSMPRGVASEHRCGMQSLYSGARMHHCHFTSRMLVPLPTAPSLLRILSSVLSLPHHDCFAISLILGAWTKCCTVQIEAFFYVNCSTRRFEADAKLVTGATGMALTTPTVDQALPAPPLSSALVAGSRDPAYFKAVLCRKAR